MRRKIEEAIDLFLKDLKKSTQHHESAPNPQKFFVLSGHFDEEYIQIKTIVWAKSLEDAIASSDYQKYKHTKIENKVQGKDYAARFISFPGGADCVIVSVGISPVTAFHGYREVERNMGVEQVPSRIYGTWDDIGRCPTCDSRLNRRGECPNCYDGPDPSERN